ncbi:MAG TPA: 4-hydroxy-tetrahydrodipicolinate reductase [Candidatus Acidoferrales bacterium]|nr:4-hydroxy-tetrahydrodipicolinate reductase [Candidatus Acidoferrales bacterium]
MTRTDQITVAVTGACGRMGQMIVDNVKREPDMTLVAAFDKRVCNAGVTVASKLVETLEKTKPDVLIDFTEAASSVEIIKAAAGSGVRLVVGTTGFTPEQRAEAESAIEGKVAAIISPNFSIGVNVFFQLIKKASESLPSGQYAAEVIEAHHKHKVDAPSGTAVKAIDIIKAIDHSRKVGSYSIRAGDIVGDHSALFIGEGERLEIRHQAHSRQAFASGAILAARFIVKQSPGLHSMDDLMASLEAFDSL